jgi:EAL and modified HD-GYP domain-containing signal transduction protein
MSLIEGEYPMDVFVARQPIFDRSNHVIAYELLYRTNENNFFDHSVSSNIATSILLMNSYYSFGIDNLIGNRFAYINFSKALIENDIPLLLDESHVVIELLENIKPDNHLLNKLAYFKERGFKIALDDFTFHYPYTELIDLADIIKVDFLNNTLEEIIGIFLKYKKQGKILLAEKVESYDLYLWARKVGFDFFQGYYFSKPVIMKKTALPDSAYQYFRLVEKLNAQEPNYKEIAGIIETDVTLTYKLLKLINSRFSLVNNISSIQHGLAIIGINSFKKWLSLAMLQNIATLKTPEIVKIAIIRSQFMETVARESSLRKHTEEITFVGILSVIDVLLEATMIDILHNLPLSDEVKNTLLGEDTDYATIFNILKLYEVGDFHDLVNLCDRIHFDSNKLPKIYCSSVKWAEDLFEYMQ